MSEKHIIIIGGGLAGLAAGCYAQRSGFRTTIVEHNLALGGVCTAWPRGPYVIDGCIHWLTGGPFERLYRELDILPAVRLRTLHTWVSYRDVRDGIEVPFTRDLDALAARLAEISPEDRAELARLRAGASAMSALKPQIEAGELVSARDALRAVWNLRGSFDALVHYRKPVGAWAREHLKSPRLQRLFARMLPETTPTFFLLMVLAYLEQGHLSRPVGGTAAFRDALERSYRALGGTVVLHATVDEVLVQDGCARGVRLADGTFIAGDIVISTSSSPETVLRLLGGRFEPEETRERMERWKMFDPIVLASFGVDRPYADRPSLSVLDGLTPIDCGGVSNDSLTLRVCNDDPCFAPPGHTVVQALVRTDYAWWATRGSCYGTEKHALAARLVEALDPHLPGLSAAVRVTDVATPLTYWHSARSWRGAYEGWVPSAEALMSHVHKRLKGLSGFYMAGQWMEPGGGVPMAVMSGRQAVQLLCADQGCAFVAE